MLTSYQHFHPLKIWIRWERY